MNRIVPIPVQTEAAAVEKIMSKGVVECILFILHLVHHLKPIPMEQTLDIAAVPVATEASLFDYKTSRDAAEVLRAINNDFRQQILDVLHRNRQLTVTDIFVKLRIDQSVASQHLSVLRNAKLVNTTRDGKYIHYSVNYQRVEKLKNIIHQLLN